MLSSYAKREWLTIVAIGVLVSVTCLVVYWPLAIVIAVATIAVLTFFRDPDRRIPTQRGAVVSPADGRVSSVHEVEHFEPFDGPAVCVRIFLSVLNVHVNRSPCHGVVKSITHRPGDHLNALNPESAEANEATLMVLVHPFQNFPIAAVRQVAGLLARTIVCAAHVDETLQRGQRFGIIKLGSTTELYLPLAHSPQVRVTVGDRVYGGATVLATVHPQRSATAPDTMTATDVDAQDNQSQDEAVAHDAVDARDANEQEEETEDDSVDAQMRAT